MQHSVSHCQCHKHRKMSQSHCTSNTSTSIKSHVARPEVKTSRITVSVDHVTNKNRKFCKIRLNFFPAQLQKSRVSHEIKIRSQKYSILVYKSNYITICRQLISENNRCNFVSINAMNITSPKKTEKQIVFQSLCTQCVNKTITCIEA